MTSPRSSKSRAGRRSFGKRVWRVRIADLVLGSVVLERGLVVLLVASFSVAVEVAMVAIRDVRRCLDVGRVRSDIALHALAFSNLAGFIVLDFSLVSRRRMNLVVLVSWRHRGIETVAAAS